MGSTPRAAEILLAYHYGRPSSLDENELAGMLNFEEMSKRAAEALGDMEKMSSNQLQEALSERPKLSIKEVRPTS